MGELERQGLYIAGSGGHQYADFAPNPSGHLVRWSDAAARIRELEAEVKRLQVANGRILIEKDELANAAAGKIDSANATLERVRAALNVQSYDTDPYSDVRVVDVEDLREALAPTSAEGGSHG